MMPKSAHYCNGVQVNVYQMAGKPQAISPDSISYIISLIEAFKNDPPVTIIANQPDFLDQILDAVVYGVLPRSFGVIEIDGDPLWPIFAKRYEIGDKGFLDYDDELTRAVFLVTEIPSALRTIGFAVCGIRDDGRYIWEFRGGMAP